MAHISALYFTTSIKIKKGATYKTTITPATLSADVTVTLPAANGAAMLSKTDVPITLVEVITHTDTKKYIKMSVGGTFHYAEMITALP